MAGEIDPDDRTSAVGLFNTARSYWRSAEALSALRLELTHPEAPVRFLFCHATELYLKAYLRAAGISLGQLKGLGHHVARLAAAARQSGLPIAPEPFEILDHIDSDDVAIEARYIVTGFKSMPTIDGLSLVAGELDRTVCHALAQFRLPVRQQEFEAPVHQPKKNQFSQDTLRVLLRMFSTPDLEGRDVGVMAHALQLQRNVLQYHLDCLEEAKLAEITGGNVDGSVYWNLTAEGRRYVIEHKLI